MNMVTAPRQLTSADGAALSFSVDFLNKIVAYIAVRLFFNLKIVLLCSCRVFFRVLVFIDGTIMQNEAGEYVDMYIPRKW